MNDRIQQLIEQASSWSVIGEYGQESEYRLDAEKLAKLIAAECADLAADIDGGENMISRGIRKRFEV